eukprot:3568927-Pleurochrysis_carterae.AAC.1
MSLRKSCVSTRSGCNVCQNRRYRRCDGGRFLATPLGSGGGFRIGYKLDETGAPAGQSRYGTGPQLSDRVMMRLA